MYSVLVFLVTLIQLLAVLGAYLVKADVMFLGMVYYGSPFYLLMHILGGDSLFDARNTLYLWIGIYHLLKYFMLFKAQMESRGILLTCAILFETAYLCVSGYYIN